MITAQDDVSKQLFLCVLIPCDHHTGDFPSSVDDPVCRGRHHNEADPAYEEWHYCLPHGNDLATEEIPVSIQRCQVD